MKLKAKIEKLEDVEEQYRGLYTEVDGKFILGVEEVDGWALDDVRGLRSGIQSARATAKEAKDKLEAYAGMDPTEAKNAIEAVSRQAAAGDDVEEKIREKYIARERTREEKHLAEVQKLAAAVEDRKRKHHAAELERHVQDAIKAHEGNELYIGHHVRQRVRVEEDDDGNLTFPVVGDDGKVLYSEKPGENKLMTAEELVGTKFKSDPRWIDAFPGAQKRGTGAKGSDNGSGGPRIDPNLSPKARVDAYFASNNSRK